MIEGSRADVSFVAGLLMDKFAYHFPFYRQHQRLKDCGDQSHPAVADADSRNRRHQLLEPIYEAQLPRSATAG